MEQKIICILIMVGSIKVICTSFLTILRGATTHRRMTLSVELGFKQTFLGRYYEIVVVKSEVIHIKFW